MHRIAVFAFLVMLASLPSALAASLEPEELPPGADAPPAGPPPGLADRDRNGLSDDLQAKLAAARPNDRFDVVVTFSGPGNAESAQRAVGAFEVRQEFTIIDGFAATMTAAQIQGLARTRGVFRVEEDFEVTTQMDGARAAFGVDMVHAASPGRTGEGVTVCVLDTGVDTTHEQLDSQGTEACWFDAVNNQPSPYDDHNYILSGSGHGTHVASIAVGDGQGGANAAKYRGVAPKARLCAAKVLNAQGSGTESAIISGIEWCAQRADILSMSIGTAASSDGQDGLSQAVNNAAGDPYYAIPVVAAGNSGDDKSTIGSPGAAAKAITVGAVYKWQRDGDALVYFSSRGPITDGGGNVLRIKPDVTAPGVNITAAQACTSTSGCTPHAGYTAKSGTSMATPFMAGAVALALEADSTLTVDDVKALLSLTSVDRGPVDAAPDHKDPDWGYGNIDVRALVMEASGQGDLTPFPTYERITDTINKNGQKFYSFDLTADELTTPIGINIDIEGRLVCRIVFGFFIVCGWDPDLDAELYDPDNNLVASSGCPAIGECGQAGRWETMRFQPTKVGTYRVRVYAVQDDFNRGNGGDFALYFASDPLESEGGGDPSPPTTNTAPVANSDPYSATVGAQLVVGAPGVLGNDTDAEDDPLTVRAVEGSTDNVGTSVTLAHGALVLQADGSFTYNPGSAGNESFTYAAFDGVLESEPATVTITVSEPTAASTMHVGDLDGSTTSIGKKNWRATVVATVHDSDERSVEGATVGFGGSSTCTTNASGQCSVSSGNLSTSIGSVTFEVGNVTHPTLSYSSGANHDPDGDSDGTSITVLKP